MDLQSTTQGLVGFCLYLKPLLSSVYVYTSVYVLQLLINQSLLALFPDLITMRRKEAIQLFFLELLLA